MSLKLIVSFVFLLSIFSAHAADSIGCATSINDAYIELDTEARYFNDRKITNVRFAAIVSKVSAQVTASKAYCEFFEDPKIKKCVELIVKRYDKLRDKISMFAILSGRQTEVEISFLDDLSDSLRSPFYELNCATHGVKINL